MMELAVMETTAEMLIEKIKYGYTDIVHLYQSAPLAAIEEPIMTNGWTVKDVVTHIAAWDWRCALLLEVSHDTDAPFHAEPDVDALNHEFYLERKTWSWGDVERDFREAHEAVLTAIYQMPHNRLDDAFIQACIAEETWEHYAEHLPDLRQWQQRVTDH